jgi:hypothetical protein
MIQPSNCDTSSDANHVVFSLNLDASLRVATDKILQWPVFDGPLSPLRQFKFVDFHGFEAYTYLDDISKQSDERTSPRLAEKSWESPRLINISTARCDIEPLVDQFFNRVNIKNPILSRRMASQYCQRYYEHGALFNLETCLVLLTCALGAISMEFDHIDRTQSPGLSHSSSQLPDLRLGYVYFIAAEKRLGSAISIVNTLAIQCLCLAG